AYLGKLQVLKPLTRRQILARSSIGDRQYEGADAQYLGKGQRHQSEIAAFQPVAKADGAGDQRDKPASQPGSEKRGKPVPSIVDLQDHAGIKAGAEEGG